MSYPGPPPRSRLSHGWTAVKESALDLFYPRLCWCCEVPLPADSPRQGTSAWFCSECEGAFVPVEAPYCSVCGEPFDGAMEADFRCWNCEGRKIHFDFAVAGFKAEGHVRELIHRFKYHRLIALRGAVAELLLSALQDPRLQLENLQNWLLVPVPLHPSREQDRQFNQSWELCRRLAKRTGIPAAQVLARTNLTDAQAGLDRRQRLENMRGIFTLRRARPWRAAPDIAGRRILLVDDVLTTGATTHECAKILKHDGKAEKVVVITAARG